MIFEYWNKLKKKNKAPKFYKGTVIVDSKKFNSDFSNTKNLKKYIDCLYNGKFLLIKNVYTKKQIKELKERVLKIEKTQKQSFYRLNKKVPNFWRRITKKISKKYSVLTDRTSWYFFRWNRQSKFYYDLFTPIWRKIKILHGFKKDVFEKLTPINQDHVDRIQVVRYPDKSGFIETHRHPFETLCLGISVYLSDNKNDFMNGGTYFLKNLKKKVYVEDYISSGDVGIFYSSLYHGVTPVTGLKKKLVIKLRGRWWCGLYSPESDLKKNRLTSMKLKNV